jgi:Beta-lactamase
MNSSVKFNAIVQFNAIAFEEAIHRECAGIVKGYSFVVADEDGIRAKVSGGWAQAPGDGDVPMKTFVSSCIGSVSKVLSAIALLHLFDRHQLSDGLVQEQLDTMIWDKLPGLWRDSFLNRNIDKITYRQLLQHKSGFLVTDGEAKQHTTGTKMSYVLSKGVQTSDMGDREYNNFNIAILLFLIPAIAYPEATENIHQKYKHLNVDGYSKEITPEYGRLYGRYMHEVIFPKALEQISPTCQPLESLPHDRYARHYSSLSDQSGGVINGEFCRAQGGWYISAQELAHFARTFAFTDRYIGPTTRASLYDPTHPDDRIVYSRTIEHDGFADELGQQDWAYHGGDQGGYHAALVKLPYDCYGIGMVNSSDRGNGGAIARFLIDAFYKATR